MQASKPAAGIFLDIGERRVISLSVFFPCLSYAQNCEIVMHFLCCLEEGKDTVFDMSVTVFCWPCFVAIFVEEYKISSNRLSWRKLSVKFLTRYFVALKEISLLFKQSLKRNSSTRG